MSLNRRRLLVFGLALLLGLVMGYTALSRAGYRAETQALDRFFPLRFKFFGPQPIDPRLVLVGVDSATVDAIGKPLLFWQPDLARLIALIKEGKPSVVGLDFLISPKTEGLSADDPVRNRLQDEAMELGLSALGGPPVILVERYAVDEFSTGRDGQGYEDEQVFSPHEIVRDLLLQPDGSIPAFGIANVPTDPDGAVRRMKLFHWRNQQTRAITPSNFALKLLEQGTSTRLDFETTRFGSEEPTLGWKDVQVPFIFDESFLLNYPGPTEDNPAPGEPAPPASPSPSSPPGPCWTAPTGPRTSRTGS